MLHRWNPEIYDDKGRFGQLVLIGAVFCVLGAWPVEGYDG